MFQLESSNIQNILIALVVICAIVYGFIEFRKVNMKLELLESKLSKITHPMEMHMMGPPPEFQGNAEEGNTKGGNAKGGNAKGGNAKGGNAKGGNAKGGNTNEEELLDTGENSVHINDPLIDKMINQVENENDIVEQSGIDTFVMEQEILPEVESMTEVVDPITEVVESISKVVETMKEVGNPVTEKGIFVSVMTKPSNTIDITEDERIVDLDELDESPNTSYMPSDNKEDPEPELNYEEFSIKELKNTLEERGLSTSGSKTKLIERMLSSKK